jgi:hypothetical protein
MADIISFKKAKKQQLKNKSQGMCQHGHHQWEVVKENPFDVKQGGLLTLYRCRRCKKEKTKIH